MKCKQCGFDNILHDLEFCGPDCASKYVQQLEKENKHFEGLLEQDNKELRAENEQQAEQITAIKAEKDEAYNTWFELSQMAARDRSEFEQKIEQQAEQIHDLNNIIVEQDAEIERLKELQDDTQDHCIDTLQDMLLIKEQENKSLIDERNHLANGLVQANLDIITLERRNDTMDKDYDLLVEVITEQDAEITRLKDEMAESDGCISDTLTLLADYDGYTTERGLRTLVDRAEELLQTHKPMVFKTEKEWESIEKLKSNQSKFSG